MSATWFSAALQASQPTSAAPLVGSADSASNSTFATTVVMVPDATAADTDVSSFSLLQLMLMLFL